MLPAPPLADRGLIRASLAGEKRRVVESHAVPAKHQFQPQLQILNQRVGPPIYSFEDGVWESHARPLEQSSSSEPAQCQLPNQVLEEEGETGEAHHRACVRSRGEQISPLHDGAELCCSPGDLMNGIWSGGAVGIDDNDHAIEIWSDMSASEFKRISFAALVGLVTLYHPRAKPRSQGARIVGAVVGYDNQLITKPQLSQHFGNCPLDAPFLVMCRHQDRDRRYAVSRQVGRTA